MKRINNMRSAFIVFIFITVITSCKKTTPVNSGGNNNGTPTAQFFEYLITPSTTNTSISSYNNDHYVCIDTRLSLKNKLFVFLPGTTGFPSAYKLIVKKAASLGYHAIGLMYPNSTDIYTAASNSADNNEFGRCRQEIFDGSNQTNGVSVDTNNCIKSRLYKLLYYLQQQHPDQNWGQYLLNGSINWSKIVISGHSQGGGHAFYIAKQVGVDKAISFSSIDWNSSIGASANWVTTTGATPISKFYSFNGTNDEIFNYTNVQTQLADMNMIGPAVSIDMNAAPYNNSHTLTTSTSPAFSIIFPNHNLTVLDQYVPKSSNGAVAATFTNAWEYLLNN